MRKTGQTVLLKGNFISFSQIYFLREEGVPEADIYMLKFMVFWAVYSTL